MKRPSSLTRDRWWLAGIVLILAVIYGATMAPGLTWLHDSVDGGDLITAAATGGVAHPSGYPVYLVLARIFQSLPAGQLAFRTNLLSAAASVLTSLLIFKIVRNQIEASLRGDISAFYAALMFGLAPLIWSQSIVSEVYTLNAFFVALILWVLSFQPQQKLQFDGWPGFLLGLGMGNHLTLGLLFPLVFLPPILDRHLRSLLLRVTLTLVGLSVYLLLPLRALSHPLLNWGGVDRFQNFLWLVSGRLYQDQLTGIGFVELVARVRAASGLLVAQFGVVGLCLGLLGIVVYFKPERIYWSTLWVACTSLMFALCYGTFDSYVYLIPAFLSFAIWIGLGIGSLPRNWMVAAGLVLAVGFLGIQTFANWQIVDASNDVEAEEFGRQVMQTMPQDALVFMRGDRAIFTVWYFHYALGARPDLAVIATDLLVYDWYRENLLMNYSGQGLSVKAQALELIQSNPGRPFCFVEHLGQRKISCQP